MSSRGIQGAAPLTGTAPPPTAARRAPSAAEVRAAYHNRLDEQVNRAIDAFKEVVGCCEIRDKATNARKDFQSQVESANLAKASDELLRLVSELKIAVIVQDVQESEKECMEMRSIYDVEQKTSLGELGKLRDSVSASLSRLEKHYYASCTRWGMKDNEYTQ